MYLLLIQIAANVRNSTHKIPYVQRTANRIKRFNNYLYYYFAFDFDSD